MIHFETMEIQKFMKYPIKAENFFFKKTEWAISCILEMYQCQYTKV